MSRHEQWTAECLPHGDGQCDGTHHDGIFAGLPCGCWCHGTDDLPPTTEQVKAWHDRMHGLVAQ